SSANCLIWSAVSNPPVIKTAAPACSANSCALTRLPTINKESDSVYRIIASNFIAPITNLLSVLRSEERRVGKGCRSKWSSERGKWRENMYGYRRGHGEDIDG